MNDILLVILLACFAVLGYVCNVQYYKHRIYDILSYVFFYASFALFMYIILF